MDLRWQLVEAVRTNNTSRVRRLLGKGASPDTTDQAGVPMLARAAWLSSLPVVQLLLEAGADANKTHHSMCGGSVLMSVAGCPGVDGIVQALLRAGADVAQRDWNGQTALVDAAIGGDPATIVTLLQAGADPLERDRAGLSAVDQALIYARPHAHRLLQQAAWRRGLGVLLLACRRRRRALFLPAELWEDIATGYLAA